MQLHAQPGESSLECVDVNPSQEDAASVGSPCATSVVPSTSVVSDACAPIATSAPPSAAVGSHTAAPRSSPFHAAPVASAYDGDLSKAHHETSGTALYSRCDPRLVEKLRRSLLLHANVVIALLHRLDVTRCGAVSRTEFRKALPMLMQRMLVEDLRNPPQPRSSRPRSPSSARRAASPRPRQTIFTAAAAASDPSLSRAKLEEHQRPATSRGPAASCKPDGDAHRGKLADAQRVAHGSPLGGDTGRGVIGSSRTAEEGHWSGLEMDVIFDALDSEACGAIRYAHIRTRACTLHTPGPVTACRA